jgi:hypothetical protein
MTYDGPFDILTLIFAGILTLQWSVPWLIACAAFWFIKKPRRRPWLIWTLAGVAAIFIFAVWGLDACNTSYNFCPLDAIPSIGIN